MVTLGGRKIWQWLTSSDANADRINQSRKGPKNYDCVGVVFWDSFQFFVTTNEKEEGSIIVRRNHQNKLTVIDLENFPIFMTEVGYDVGGTITL